MGISEAKKLIGKKCDIRWLDRAGQEILTVSTIHDVTYVPLYGGYLITDMDDILLEKVVTACVAGMVASPVAPDGSGMQIAA